MSLMERIAARRCAVVDCDRERVEDGPCCRDDMRELWMNRLDRQPDGTYTRRRTFTARETTWQRAA